MTINEINQWQDIVRGYNNSPIPLSELSEKCAKAGLLEVNTYLLNNHYIARMKDGNTFINWSQNKYYPDATIINLKAELKNETRPLTLEERVMILEKTVKELEKRMQEKELFKS